ncbi:unnamed protein product, partial [Polarella glacialis]
PGRTLSAGDVNDSPPSEAPRDARTALREAWDKRVLAGRPSLTLSILDEWQGTLCASAIFHLLEICVQFVSPLVIRSIVTFVDSEDQNLPLGIIYAVCFFITPLLQCLLSSHFILHGRRLGMRTQGATACLVFEKALRLSQPASTSYGPGALVNIMQVDTFRFAFAFFHLNFM